MRMMILLLLYNNIKKNIIVNIIIIFTLTVDAVTLLLQPIRRYRYFDWSITIKIKLSKSLMITMVFTTTTDILLPRTSLSSRSRQRWSDEPTNITVTTSTGNDTSNESRWYDEEEWGFDIIVSIDVSNSNQRTSQWGEIYWY